MGSTSETYENGTNVVVYVANENARIRSHQRQQQQQHQHRYHSQDIVSAHLHTTGDDHESVFNVCPEYGPSSITVSSYETETTIVAEKHSSSFDISHHDDSDSCAINGDSMRDDTSFASYNGDDSDKLLIDKSSNPCYAGNELNVEPVPVLAPAVAPSFGSENLNESGVANANFAAISDTSYARSESVRSADSVCSSLSSSSAGGNSKVAPPNENFFANASANTSASCATAGGNFDTSQGSVTFPLSYRVVPAPNKESGSPSFQKPTVSVPYGWKRFLKNGSIIYISPSNSVLTSLEQVNSYLLTDGNCFCGLDCPLYSHTVFNFDPEVVTSSVPASSGGFAKLCNHKRKRIAESTGLPTGLPNQPYETIPLQSDSIASRPLIANYCNPGANVKKHVFDISDRRKKRKHMPGPIYTNDDTPVPSPLMNDCDISAKENNPSVIPASSQVDVPIYNQQMEMTTGMPEQQLGSTVCLKSSFNSNFSNPQTYYNSGGGSNHDKNMTNNPNNTGNSNNHHNQDYGFHVQPNDCFVVNANHNRLIANQANVFVTQNEFRANQNNAGYVCNAVENNVPSQTYVDNTNMNQHHHMGCGNMMPQNHPMNTSSQQPPGQVQFVAQQQLPQQKQQQFQQQHQHQHQHPVNQQGNFQPMRVIPNHQHHHHVHHQRANNPMTTIDGGPKQMVPNTDLVTLDKSDRVIYEQACDRNATAQCRVPKNGNSFCNCYHVEKGHMHQPSPQQMLQHTQAPSCVSDCGGNCSSVIVQNAQGQQIIMQPNHQMVAYDGTTISMQPKMMHRQPMQQHHPRVQSQMPSSMGQVYPHHPHHQQPPPPNQQQTQAQQMYIMQQQQQQHQHQQHQQMQMMQNQNQRVSHADDMKAAQSQCGSMMHLQMNGGNQSNRGHVNNIMTQRQPVMWQQKNVQHASINTSHQCSETTSVSVSPPNPYERVPPLHAHVAPSTPAWNEEAGCRKKFVKNHNHKTTHTVVTKKMKLSIDGRTGNQTTSNSTAVSSTNTTNSMMKDRNDYANTPVPSFMDDPSGYLAQQTALLQSTISKQTGENPHFKERTVCYSQSSSASSTSFSYKTQSRNQPAAQHEDNPVTSSTYERERNVSLSPSDSRSPIQAGTVSTSNQSPVQPGMTSPSTASTNSDTLPQSPAVARNVRENDSPVAAVESSRVSSAHSAVTTVTSGHTCSSNTITSVLAGKANTAVVATNNSPPSTQPTTTTTTTARRSPSRRTASDERPGSANTTVLSLSHLPHAESQIATKSPLEMVQSVVSSIQIPQQHQAIEPKTSIPQNSLQTSHFLVSNNGQLLVATSSNPTVVSQQSLTKVNSPISMISNSSVVTNVTGTVTQVIPTVGVAQQVLGQPTMLVNTLPSGQFVFQPSMMAVHSAANAMQIPQLTVATNGVVSSQTLADAAGAISVATSGSFSPRGQAQLLSPETAKRKLASKKRKISPQQVLQITQSAAHGGVVTSAAAAATTNSMVVQSQAQQNFAQSAPMLQTLILPNKGNQFASTQPLIATANVLQPLNLVHNIPTIQQFIVPAGLGGLGGMVMANGDGTATILPDTVQLNVLTPMQNAAGTVFGHAAGQGILTASPTTGMVIRTQPNGATTATVNQLRSQTISTPGGAQFITTTPTLIVATNNTFSQTSSSYSGSPPDTTTHSPIGNSGQSPDTPSSSIVVGSTDDIASPTSSSSIGSDLQRQPMVYCISSSNVVDWTDTAMEEKKVNIIVEEKKVQCSLIFKEDAV